MKRKKRKNNEGSWGEKTIHGKKYLYFKKTYILSDGTKDEKYYYGATVKEINEKKVEYETNLSKPVKKDTIFGDYITQLSQLISANNACINLACEAIQSVTLLFMQAVISADSIEICSTNRAIRLWRASVSSMS